MGKPKTREQKQHEAMDQLAIDYALLGDAEARLNVLEEKGKRAIELGLPLMMRLYRNREYGAGSEKNTWRTPRRETGGYHNTGEEAQGSG